MPSTTIIEHDGSHLLNLEDDPLYINEYGDNMKNYKWDGPEDSDEEIEDMANLKTDYEIE